MTDDINIFKILDHAALNCGSWHIRLAVWAGELASYRVRQLPRTADEIHATEHWELRLIPDDDVELGDEVDSHLLYDLDVRDVRVSADAPHISMSPDYTFWRGDGVPMSGNTDVPPMKLRPDRKLRPFS